MSTPPPIVKVLATSAAISQALATEVAALSAQRIAESGRFTVAISGGSLPAILCKDLANDSSVDWSKWIVFLADERCVPNDHPDSNLALIQKELLSKVGITNMHSINDALLVAKDGSCGNDETAKVAADYEQQLRFVFGANIVFDLILLGMGPDGHTASLFPGHRLLNVVHPATPIAYVVDSPKPPPARITLTYPVLNAAKKVIFVSTGEGKAQVLYDILLKGDDYPSGILSSHAS
ncbi:Glucosamine/galactosamine-6-phosphate isomerase [Chytriomyces sp. MP71]|nr:Glucosamine/galactosamine-6-phosphate isomerase [Chytriomyces sp. MP71]